MTHCHCIKCTNLDLFQIHRFCIWSVLFTHLVEYGIKYHKHDEHNWHHDNHLDPNLQSWKKVNIRSINSCYIFDNQIIFLWTYCQVRVSPPWSQSSWSGRLCPPSWPPRTRCTCLHTMSQCYKSWGEDDVTHGELGQFVSPAAAAEREELSDRVIQVQQHHLSWLAARHPLIQQPDNN